MSGSYSALYAWTSERVELLTKLWNDGATCSEIAAALDGIVSRNAVIGKVTRLGLPKRKDTSAFYTPKPKRPRAERTIRRNGSGFVRAESVEADDAPPDVASVTELESSPLPPGFQCIALIDLGTGHCRYPRDVDGQTKFCGKPQIDGSAYCAQCHRRCHSRMSLRTVTAETAERRRRGMLRSLRAA